MKKDIIIFIVLSILGVITETAIFYFLGGMCALKMFWWYIPLSVILFGIVYWKILY